MGRISSGFGAVEIERLLQVLRIAGGSEIVGERSAEVRHARIELDGMAHECKPVFPVAEAEAAVAKVEERLGVDRVLARSNFEVAHGGWTIAAGVLGITEVVPRQPERGIAPQDVAVLIDGDVTAPP